MICRIGAARIGTAPRRLDGGDEQGAGAVLVLAAVAVLGLLALVVGGAASVSVARHRAAAAADFGALAAAAQIGAEPASVVCSTARRVVEANAARLVSCEVTAEWVEVQVSAEVGLGRLLRVASLGGEPPSVRARARAGREPAPSAIRPTTRDTLAIARHLGRNLGAGVTSSKRTRCADRS